MEYNRRNFLKISGLAFGGTIFATSCKITLPGYYFFTNQEALCVIAICEQIIPADKDPGATDACVINYIDRQLSTNFKSLQSLYRNGIEAIQNTSSNLYNLRFEELDKISQKDFLENMQKGKLTGEQWKDFSQAQFFNNMVQHTMQGFYGSPRHGGNKDYVSYTMMGLEYPLVVGQNRYKNQLQK